MPRALLNNEGNAAANVNYNGTVPASGDGDFILLNETRTAVVVSVRGSSTTMGATLDVATNPEDVTVFAEADRAAGDPVITAKIPAGGYVTFNVAKSDAGAGNLQIRTDDLMSTHMTSAQVGQAVLLNTILLS